MSEQRYGRGMTEKSEQDHINEAKTALLNGIVHASKNSNAGEGAKALAEAYVILTALSTAKDDAERGVIAEKYIDKRLDGRR